MEGDPEQSLSDCTNISSCEETHRMLHIVVTHVALKYISKFYLTRIWGLRVRISDPMHLLMRLQFCCNYIALQGSWNRVMWIHLVSALILICYIKSVNNWLSDFSLKFKWKETGFVCKWQMWTHSWWNPLVKTKLDIFSLGSGKRQSLCHQNLLTFNQFLYTNC